jgi:STE24 endopeptidase
MQIVVLAAFVVSLVFLAPETLSRLAAPGALTPAAVVAYVGLAFLLARLNTELAFLAVRRRSATRAVVLRRHNRLLLVTHLWLIGGLAAVVGLGYGQWVMRTLGLAAVPLVGKLLAVSPFIAALLLTWVANYPFYRLVRVQLSADGGGGEAARAWTLRQYLSYNCRHHLLFILVPVALIVLAEDLLWKYVEPALPDSDLGGMVLGAAMGAAALGVFFVAPVLIVRIWRTEPLPDTPLRRGLESLCRRLKLRYRDILVWKSEGMIANAGVMGLAGRVRYVLLADGLLERMSPEEIKAVFAHEAGHIVSHHIFFSAVFAVAASAFSALAAEPLAAALGLTFEGEWGTIGVMLALLIGTWGLGFGYLSRRFERQSDVIAAWVIGREAADPADDRGDPGRITPEGAAVFSRALERVAELNGIPPRQHNWRHGSIAGRVSYVLWLGATGGSRREIDALVGRIKVVLLVALVAGLTAVLAGW